MTGVGKLSSPDLTDIPSNPSIMIECRQAERVDRG